TSMLITIDPIDYHYCGQAIFGNIGNSDCRSTPRRLFENNNYLLNSSLSAVDVWQNIYQTTARWLHSGAIPGIDVGRAAGNANILLPFSRFFSQPHMSIADDQRTWDQIGLE